MKSYHKITKKLQKLEKKFPEYAFMGINNKELINSDKGREYQHQNITKLPQIYRFIAKCEDSFTVREIKRIIGE